MVVGNIVSTSKVDVLDDFNVVRSLDEIIQGLPTLIVGYDVAIKHFPDLDVLTRKAADNVFFTFRKNERREFHEEDVYKFKRYAYSSLIKKITYYFVDPMQLSLKSIKKVIKKLYSLDKSVAYQHDDMVYVYGEDIVFGIDLTLLEFLGVNRDKFISKLSKDRILLQKNEIFIEYKNKVENIDNQVKFIPYLYSIEHG
jgi:hypothetical protein